MNPKLLLVKGITLLYRESMIPNLSEKSSELVRKIISVVKLPETSLTLDHEGQILEGLRNLAQTMCDDPLDITYEENEVLQHAKVICGDDENTYQALRDGILLELPEGKLKKACLSLKRSIQNFFREAEVKEILNKSAGKLKFQREQIPDMKKFVAELCAALEPYQADLVTSDPAIVSQVSFTNEDDIVREFKQVKKDVSGNGILKTGWQAINRMLRGGVRRGECVVIGALQHNFKTGFTLGLFKHFALYNQPEMIDSTKKPLLVHMSFENEMNTNLHLLYKSLKENETGILLTDNDISETPESEMGKYIKEKMGVNGYHIEMIRINPSLWSYMDICNKIIEFESDGYEPHALVLDYLSMVPTTGCKQSTNGEDIRDLFRRMRNFCSARKIALVTPHQLSSDAKQLIRDGRQDFVKEIANKGYYDGCKRLDQEVDLEMYIHIEKINSLSYLTVQRGKHRTVVGQTPPEDLYTVLPFEKIAAIPDDVNGIDRSRKKPGAGMRGSADENPFWEFNETGAF